jgi:hypothetical protein
MPRHSLLISLLPRASSPRHARRWLEAWLSTTPVVAAGMVSFVLANLFYTV